MHDTSGWLWRFNLLLLRLQGEISISLLCAHSSWGSAMVLAPPLHVSRPLASVLCPDRWELKKRLIRGVWLTQAKGREGYGMRGEPAAAEAWCDIATAWGALFVLLGKLSLDHGTLVVAGCTGSQEGRCELWPVLVHRLLGGCSSSVNVSCLSLLSALIATAHAFLCSSFRQCSESPLLAHPKTMVFWPLDSSRLFPGLLPG